MHDPDSEAALEGATLDVFADMGYETLNAEREYSGRATFSGQVTGRDHMDAVGLRSRLWEALERLNPTLPGEALHQAVEVLLANRSQKTLADANRDVYKLLREGVAVTFKGADGEEVADRVTVIDWVTAENNDWLAVQQLWLQSQNGFYKKRPDIMLFVNGLPLVVIELKAFHRHVERAYQENLRDYLDTISHLFWYNAFIILSNGRYSRIGSVTSAWEHFSEWKRISDEREAGRIDLETMLLGTCEPSRLLDLVENFTLFKQSPGGLAKLIARNHQYLGVNNAIEAVQSIADNHGRLGVFWHTQGSGKSYSMVFFSQKVLRKLPGNWTFVIVTDREELDGQIYQNFADVGVVPNVKGKQRGVQAQSGDDLKRLLREDHRYVFTLIQKFHTRGEDGDVYPVLSERDDIIVMTDEAHRSQYDIFASNMRQALPNAAFIGFTGTPLMAGEEKTRQEFGEYVSVYDFKQSVEDGATVPLYYENRIPKVQLANEQLNNDMIEMLDEAMLDEAQEEKLERTFQKEYQVITRETRQDAIARDIVAHYQARGFAGRSYNSKAMVVCIDKLTAVRMYERVQVYWQQAIADIEADLAVATDAHEQEQLTEAVDFMRSTDMAVVISSAQGEVDFFRQRGVEIEPHRERIVKEDLDTKFKDPENPLRVAFVCAMWMTGFDAPACATIYLDKPMRNHTLMQTIARANRVFRDKQNGLIVDYIGVFRNLEKALAIYGTGTSGTAAEGEMPIQRKQERVEALRAKIREAEAFCERLGIDMDAILRADGYDRLAYKRDAVEALLVSDAVTQQFMTLVRDVNRLHRSILPDKAAGEFVTQRRMLNILVQAVLSEVPDADISVVEGKLSDLLDTSVVTEKYVIEADPADTSRRYDLSQIDFDALRERFERGHKRTATEKLLGTINRRLQQMVRQNRTRLDYRETFQHMIDEYNSGAVNVDVMFERLVDFVEDLHEEEKRSLKEQLTEEELAIFDLLTKPAVDLTDKEREQVKAAARDLLKTLKEEKLVLDWRKHQRTQAAVRQSIAVMLDKRLPETYDTDLYEQKCEDIYRHVYESYFGPGRSIYESVA